MLETLLKSMAQTRFFQNMFERIHGEIYRQITSGDILELPDDEKTGPLGFGESPTKP